MREDGVQKDFFPREGLGWDYKFQEGWGGGMGRVDMMGTCQVRWGFRTSRTEGGAWRVICRALGQSPDI